MLNLAFQLTEAKYGTNVPDWIIKALWIAPIVPFAWWFFSHPRLTKHRDWIKERYRARPSLTVTLGIVSMAIVVTCSVAIGHSIWKVITETRQPPKQGSKPPTNLQSTKDSDLERNLLTQITGGDQPFIVNPWPIPGKSGRWMLHVYNSGGPIIKDAKALICSVTNLNENVLDLWRKSIGTTKGPACLYLSIGDIASADSGMGSLSFNHYAPLKSGNYFIDMMTRTKRFSEKLQLSPNIENYEVYAGDKLALWGCNSKCTWCSSEQCKAMPQR